MEERSREGKEEETKEMKNQVRTEKQHIEIHEIEKAREYQHNEQFYQQSYHSKAVADPESSPATRALGDLCGLAVHGDHIGRGLAHRAPRDERDDLRLGHLQAREQSVICSQEYQESQ